MSNSPLVNDLRQQATERVAVGGVCSKIIASLLLLGALWSLTGCQGLSTGSTNQSQSGTISVTNPSLAFGSVKAGSSKTVSTTATNSGSAAVTINSVAISTKYFTLSSPSLPVTIAAGQSVPLSVAFTPNAAGTFNGSVSISSTATDSVTSLALSGTGTATETTAGQLTLNPGSASFGNVTVGSSRSSTFTLTNGGGTSVDVSQVSLSGSGFHISGITASTTVNASQSMTFSVAFAPQVTGSATGSVTITSNGSDPSLTIPLSGTGTDTVTATTAQLAVAPTTLGLGNVVVGTSGTGTGTLSASGGSVTVTGVTSSNSVFAIGGISLPVTIPAGQDVPFTVTFSPQVSGTAGATLTFASNAQPSSTTESLTGSGTPAPTHSVNLSWAASTSANVSGYNIYRGQYSTSCGTFKKLNSQLNTGTLYTDSTVADGTSYCYAVTTVNSSNGESGYSNIVSNLQIPAP